MNKNTKIILLSIISVLIIIVIVLGVTSAFMRPINETSSITSVNLESCAHITLSDTGESINLSNSYPMTKNRALETTPYTFSVSSSCEGDTGFNLYLATLNTNTLPDSSIHYIITEHDNKTILEEGILSDAQNSVSDFEDYEIEQLNNGIGGTYGNIYKIFNGPVSSSTTSYDLYLYIDESVTNETMNQTFSAGVAVKAGEYEPPTIEEICSDDANSSLLACHVLSQYTGVDGDNGLYYHDADLENGAGDNSYRYAGANPNNYVCFGSDASTCPSDNLYRIIGVFGNQVKLIKADYTTTTMTGSEGDYYGAYSYSTSNYKGSMSKSNIASYYWNNNTDNNTWSESRLNTTNLNSSYLSYIGSTWSNKIARTTWYVGGHSTSGATPKTWYNAESSGTTYNAKIGLMYVSDYGFAASPSAWTTNMSSYSSARDNNWMYMGLYEWTISRRSGNSSGAFGVYTTGHLYSDAVYTSNNAVRPVFYLTSSITYNRGSGTAADPVRIN